MFKRWDNLSVFLCCLLFPLFFLPSCRVPVSPGILMNTWYICDELHLAVRFDASGGGQYISTHRALATPQPFRFRQSSRGARFRFEGGAALRGRITVVHDRFYLATGEGTLAFRQYVTRAFPRAPHRYRDELFPEVTRTEVTYGRAPGFYASKTVDNAGGLNYARVIIAVAERVTSNLRRGELPLQMDIYLPAGDQLSRRPLVVLLHGGAFIIGDKRDELMTLLSGDLARRGFVVASVNYRLGYVFLPGRYVNLERAMYSAIQDTRAALRYLSHHRERYRIDPDFVFLGGSSAGGITALKTAFMDDAEAWPSVRGSLLRLQPDLGCLDCSTNDLFGPFTLRGVINMWGAVDDPGIIKRQDRIPILSIHGDKDFVVPYGHDYPFANVSATASAFFSKRLHGPASILEHTRELGIEHTLYTFEGLGHEPQSDNDGVLIPENYEIIREQIQWFVNGQLFTPLEPLRGPVRVAPGDLTAEYWIGQGDYREHLFACDDCLILGQTPNTARVVWLAGRDDYQLRVAGIGAYGQVAIDTLTVRAGY